MSKAIRNLGLFCGIVAVSWWLGGMMYFIMVAKHFRDKEYHEKASKNITDNLRGTSDRPSDNAQIPGVERDEHATRIGSDHIRSYYQPSPGWKSYGLRPEETKYDDRPPMP